MSMGWCAYTVEVNTYDSTEKLGVTTKDGKYILSENVADIFTAEELIDVIKWAINKEDITEITISPNDPD